MIQFQWNALRIGDRVRLHGSGGDLQDGAVALIEVLKGSNGVGVRVAGAMGDEVRWPSRLAVHNPTGPIDDPCGHCGAPVPAGGARQGPTR